MSGDGIVLGWVRNSRVSNCSIVDNGPNRTADGIQVSGTNIIVESNLIHGLVNLDWHSDGITVEPSAQPGNPSDRIIIRYNTIYDCLQCIYISSYYYGEGSTGITNVEVYYNNIYKLNYTRDIHGIHFHANNDGPSPINGVKVFNNTVAYKLPVSGDTGLSFNAVTDGDARNNILYNATLLKFNSADVRCCDYNSYYRTDGGDIISWEENSFTSLNAFRAANPTYENHGQQTNPLFVSISAANHKLQNSSPCIDKGADVNLSRDIKGNPVSVGSVDMGAFEFSKKPNPPTGLRIIDR
jgi:hypothetical protein